MTQEAFAPGQHLLIDYYGANNLSDVEKTQQILVNVAEACGATVLNINLHQFGENGGVTGVALLAESHISIHTWPELAYAALDIFMCGECQPKLALKPLEAFFQADKVCVSEHARGTAQINRKP